MVSYAGNHMGQCVENQRSQNVGNRTVGNPNGNVVAPVVGTYENVNHGNQLKCYNCQGLGQIAKNCTTKPRKRDAKFFQKALLLAQKEEAGIQLTTKENDFMPYTYDMDDREDINVNCIFMANLKVASYDSESNTPLVYDTDEILKHYRPQKPFVP